MAAWQLDQLCARLAAALRAEGELRGLRWVLEYQPMDDLSGWLVDQIRERIAALEREQRGEG